jgi:hypothetical protein
MNQIYFVMLFPKDEVQLPEIKRFDTERDLFYWMQTNKNGLFVVYEGKCILDWS